jgi:hypothetical protein
MKILTINGVNKSSSNLNKGLFLYINKLLKTAIPNKVINIKFGKITGKMKIQSCNYKAVKYAVVLSITHKSSHSFDGLCRNYDYTTNTTVSNSASLYDNLY